MPDDVAMAERFVTNIHNEQGYTRGFDGMVFTIAMGWEWDGRDGTKYFGPITRYHPITIT